MNLVTIYTSRGATLVPEGSAQAAIAGFRAVSRPRYKYAVEEIIGESIFDGELYYLAKCERYQGQVLRASCTVPSD